MPTISTADFKNGLGLRIKDKVYTIVEFQHVKPGKGGAFVRYKTRDIKSGRVVENTCNAGTKFESVMLTTREFQYLYNDGADYIFTDNELLSCGELSCTAYFIFSCLYVTAFNIRYYLKRCYVLDLYPEADRSPDINASARNRTAGSVIHLRLDSYRAVVG